MTDVFITLCLRTFAETANVQAMPSSPPPTTVILLTVLVSWFAQLFEFMSETPRKKSGLSQAFKTNTKKPFSILKKKNLNLQ